MALIFRGKTRCSICGEVLEVDDEIVGFSAFLTRDHRMWRYSDSAMHAGCYAAWPERALFESLYAEAEARREEATTPQRIAEVRKQQSEERAARLERDRKHNESHAGIMVRVRAEGARCPSCDTLRQDFRELDGTDRTRLQCLACGRSCNACELRFGSAS